MIFRNLRKSVSVLVCIAMLTAVFSQCVCAAEPNIKIELTDLRTGELTVSGALGESFKNKNVSILVLNPGGTLENAMNQNQNGAIQHQWVEVTDEKGSFSYSFCLNTPIGFESGDFVFYIGDAVSPRVSKTVTYYSYEKRLEYAKQLYSKLTAPELASADAAAVNAAKTAAMNYLAEVALFIGCNGIVNSVSSGDALKNMTDKVIKWYETHTLDFGDAEVNPATKYELEIAALTAMTDRINKYAAVEAFNYGKSDALFAADRSITVDTLTGLSETVAANTTLIPVLSDITDEGRALLNESLLGKNIYDEAQLAKLYAKSIMLYGIKNNSLLGYSHLSEILTSQNAAYVGIAIPKYLAISDKNYANSLIAQDKLSLTSDNLETYIEDRAKTQTIGTGATGGSGGGTGGSGGTSYVVVTPSGGTGGSGGGVSSEVVAPVQPESTEVFNDLAGFEWAQSAILSLEKKGIVSGVGNSKYEPEGYLTREQAVKMICTALGLSGEDSSKFADETDGEWYQQYLSIARANGFVMGKDDNMFGVGGLISREDFAVMLFRAMSVDEVDEYDMDFADAASISEYSKNAVGYFTANGIINGYEDNTFRPQGSINRAEAAVLIYRLTGEGDK